MPLELVDLAGYDSDVAEAAEAAAAQQTLQAAETEHAGQLAAAVQAGQASAGQTPAPPAAVGEAPQNECPVCQEPWATGRHPHAIAALKQCGHLFGRSCLEQWLETRRKERKPADCPQCRQR